jgi:4,5-dihydroxyphthalate decarboxylase
MAGIPLTLTCGDYEITRLLAEGAVTADGIDLTVLTDIASRDRHWRLARNGECDAGEFNAFGYFMAKERGHPFIALPVFPHRRFRHGFVFVNPTKGIRTPRDLIGRRIGVEGYQTAGCVWMKGILEEFFGVPHREITWVLPRPEDIPFTPPPGLRIEYAAGDKTDEEMLIGGEIDAVITPQVPAHFRRGDKRIARLFPNYKELEIDYFQRTGVFPIMHLVVISREVVDRHPWIPANLARAFHVAKSMAYDRIRNPRVVPLAWFGDAWEEQVGLMGRDPWAFGLTEANRNTLATALRYAREQGLISETPDLSELFIDIPESVLEGVPGY